MGRFISDPRSTNRGPRPLNVCNLCVGNVSTSSWESPVGVALLAQGSGTLSPEFALPTARRRYTYGAPLLYLRRAVVIPTACRRYTYGAPLLYLRRAVGIPTA